MASAWLQQRFSIRVYPSQSFHRAHVKTSTRVSQEPSTPKPSTPPLCYNDLSTSSRSGSVFNMCSFCWQTFGAKTSWARALSLLIMLTLPRVLDAFNADRVVVVGNVLTWTYLFLQYESIGIHENWITLIDMTYSFTYQSRWICVQLQHRHL